MVNGARTGANNWTVDGADINDSGSNTTLLNVPSVDAIQEFTLGRSNYDAQYGTERRRPDYSLPRNPAPASFTAMLTNSFATMFSMPMTSSATQSAGKRLRCVTTTTVSPSAARFSFRNSTRRANRRRFSSGRKSGAKQGNPSTTTAIVPTAAQLAGTFTGQVNPGLRPRVVLLITRGRTLHRSVLLASARTRRRTFRMSIRSFPAMRRGAPNTSQA